MRELRPLAFVLLASLWVLADVSVGIAQCPTRVPVAPQSLVGTLDLAGWTLVEKEGDGFKAITGMRELTVDAGQGARRCNFEVSGDGKKLALGTCSELFAPDDSPVRDAHVSGDGVSFRCGADTQPATSLLIEKTTLPTTRATFQREVRDGKLVVYLHPEEGRELVSLIYHREDGWREKPITRNSVVLDEDADLSATSNDFVAYAASDAGGATSWLIVKFARVIPPSTCDESPLVEVMRGWYSDWCQKHANRADDHEKLCFDTTTGSIVPVALPFRSMARPNRGFIAVVRHCDDTPVTIQLDGDLQMSTPEVSDQRRALEVTRSAAETAKVLTATSPPASTLDRVTTNVAPAAYQLKTMATESSLPPGSAEPLAAAGTALSKLDESVKTYNHEVDETLEALKLADEAVTSVTLPKGAKAAGLRRSRAEVHACLRDARGDCSTANLPDDARVKVERFNTQVQSLEASRKRVHTDASEASASTERARAIVAEAVTKPRPRISVNAFGPRKPGRLALAISAGSNMPARKQELIVVPKLWGAVRVGISTIFGKDAVPPEYAIRTPSGSQTSIVTQSGGGRGAFELVLGVAPFTIDLAAWGGRSYENRDNAYVAPYIGLGVVSAEPSGIDAFKSAYFGLEVELHAKVSLAPSLVVRRVERLSGGLHPGSPIESSAALSKRDDIGLGFALVLSASPDIFQFTVPSQGKQPTVPADSNTPAEPPAALEPPAAPPRDQPPAGSAS